MKTWYQYKTDDKSPIQCQNESSKRQQNKKHAGILLVSTRPVF